MTEKEFYEQIGGSYNEALGRLMRDSLIHKFLLKFPNDPSFAALKDAVAAQDWDAAFSASHTLKGVALNLALMKLGEAAVKLTDSLRAQNRDALTAENVVALLADVETEYNAVLAGIAQLG